MLEDTKAVHATLARYRTALDDVPVYLRPTAKGLTVMSLDHQGCGSMIGVSDRGTGDEYLNVIPPSTIFVKRATAGYRRKRDSLRRASAEERYSLSLIRGALADNLRIPGSDIRLLAHEWRLPSGPDVGKIDLLGVDLSTRRLVVVELKGSRAKATALDKRARNAEQQARTYADLIVQHGGELFPFLEQLASAMTAIYDGPKEMHAVTLDRKSVAIDVRWP